MPLLVPNLQSAPTFDAQALFDATDLNAIASALDGTAVTSGCGVTPDTDMTVTVASGDVTVGGSPVSVAGGTVTASAASAYDRKDIVVVNDSGDLSIVEGTPCTVAGWTRTNAALPPVKPAIPSDSVLLAELYVAATTTEIESGNIIDKTTLLSSSGGGLPAWIQSGDGAPGGVVTPNTVGCIYFDTSGGSGLWVATGAGNTDWAGLGAVFAGGGGLWSYGGGFILFSGDESAFVQVQNGLPLRLGSNNNQVNVFMGNGDPNGTVTALAIGDLYVDLETPALYQAGTADDASWTEFGSSSFPLWFQYGSGDPITNSVVPEQAGALYYDTDGGGLWWSAADDDEDWVPLGPAGYSSSNAGLGFQNSGEHSFIANLYAIQGVYIGVVAGTAILGIGSDAVSVEKVFFPVQATTVDAPAWVLGGLYFDTTLNKLRVGGVSGWETITSA